MCFYFRKKIKLYKYTYYGTEGPALGFTYVF
jgi:hypothetical protein